MQAVRSALVVIKPFAHFITAGKKTVELRATPTRKREYIGIIEKGSGRISGVAQITDCLGPLGPDELDELRPQHLVPYDDIAAHPNWAFGWTLANAIQFLQPVPYRHPLGAQTWVTLTDLDVLAVCLAGVPSDDVELRRGKRHRRSTQP